MDRQRIFLFALLLLTACRMVLISTTDLSAEEAFVAVAAEQDAGFRWGAGAVPPLIVRIGTLLFGHNEFGVRLAAPLLALGASLILYRLAVGTGGTQAGVWSVLMVNATPLLHLGALRFTPSSAGFFFWILSSLLLWRGLHSERRAAKIWGGCGLAMGLAGSCHPLALLCALASGLAAIVSLHRWRLHVTSGRLTALGAGVLIGAFPLVLWAARSPWQIPAWFGESWGAEGARTSALGTALFGLTPLLLVGALWATAKAWPSFGRSPAASFLIAWSIIPTLLWTGSIALGLPPADLLLPCAFTPAAVLLCVAWNAGLHHSTAKVALRTAALGLACLGALAVSQPDLARAIGVPWAYPAEQLATAGRAGADGQDGDGGTASSLPTAPGADCRGWAALGEVVRSMAAAASSAEAAGAASSPPDAQGDVPASPRPGAPPFLIASTWQLASEVGFYLGDSPPVFRPTPQHPLVHTTRSRVGADRFAAWSVFAEPNLTAERSEEEAALSFLGKNAIYLAERPLDAEPPQDLVEAFQHVEPIALARIMLGKAPVREIAAFACYGYRGEPL